MTRHITSGQRRLMREQKWQRTVVRARSMKEHPKSTREVNAMIKRDRQVDAGLVQGRGYLYFTGECVQNVKSNSVAVCFVSHLSLQRWLEEFDSQRQEHLHNSGAHNIRRDPKCSECSEIAKYEGWIK